MTHPHNLLTSAAERAELVALLDQNAANHIAYSEAIGTKDERRAKREWKRSSGRMEVFAVGYLRKLVRDVDGLVAELDDLTSAHRLHASGLISDAEFGRVKGVIKARADLQREEACRAS